MTQTNFSLEVCKRLASVLGEKCPRTAWNWFNDPSLGWITAGPNDEGQGIDVEGYDDEWQPAFTIADLTKEVWEELERHIYGPVPEWQYGDNDNVSPIRSRATQFAIETYYIWLNDGYPAADKYLMELLK